MKTETRYIQFVSPGLSYDGNVAKLISEYVLVDEHQKISMIEFYTSNDQIWCIQAKQVKIITEREFFKARLFGEEIFYSDESNQSR